MGDRATPINGDVPIYLHLDNVPIDAAIAVELTWTPNSIFGPCYWIAADTVGVTGCGNTDGIAHPDSLCDSGDAYWTIRFPAGAPHACVPFVVRGGYGCGATPATFCVASVTIRTGSDPCQPVDVTGCATLYGGEGECPSALLSATPSVIPTGTETTLRLQGTGFAQGMSVELLTPDGAVQSEQTVVLSPSRATALVHPTGRVGPAGVVITSAAGVSDTLASSLVFSPSSTSLGYHPHSCIVVFKPTAMSLPAGATSAPSAQGAASSASLGQTLALAGAQGVASCSPNCLTDEALAQSLMNPVQRDIYEMSLADTNVMAACAILMADTANVIDAHPNWAFQPQDVTPPASRFGEQWWLKNTGQYLGTPGMDAKIPAAWEITTGAVAVDVGVMDLGVDTASVGLRGRATTHWPTPNGLATTVECPYPCGRDIYPHGTPVAGIIAATGNGTSPVAGVDWTARIVNLKVAVNAGQFWSSYDWHCDSCITTASMLRAVDAALARQLPIVNISVATYTSSTWLEIALGNLSHQGTFIAAASGNDDLAGACAWPARYHSYVMPVGAFDNRGNRWTDSKIPWDDYGLDHVLAPQNGSDYGCDPLLAPGGRFIQTLLPKNNLVQDKLCYDINTTRFDSLGFGGTSAAAPVVSGAAALLKSRLTHFVDGEDLRALLEATAVGAFDANDGRSIRRLNVRGAFDAVNLKFVGHGTSSGGVQVGNAVSGLWTTLHSWPGIPDGSYSASRYRIQTTVPLDHQLIARPLWWTRTAKSWGAAGLPADIWWPGDPRRNVLVSVWTPQVDTVSATASTVTMATNVYLLHSAVTGDSYWWPCDAGGTMFDFTYVGATTAPTDVEPPAAKPLSLTCSPTLARGAVKITAEGLPGGPSKITVMDVQGRVVRTVAFGSLSSGEWKNSWDLRDDRGVRVGPGLFFVRLVTPGLELTRRVIVIP